MKKLIISISVTLILFSSALFLLQENVVTLKSKKIRDVIGRNVEEKNFEKTDVMIFGLKRFIGITEKKISFLLKSMEPGWLSERGGERKLRLFFADFVNSDPHCKRIRIVNTRLEIVFSSSPQDVPRSRLNVNLYSSIFKDLPPDVSRVVVDPIIEMVIFYKVVKGSKGERYAVLFYYSQDALERVFAGIEGLNARSFLITHDKIMLVNFPEIDESEQQNLSNLVRAIGQNESGALRVIMKGMDKTIYYRRLHGQYTDWTMGLTLDTERLRISRIGVLILVVQALVIVSVLLFILSSLSKRAAARGRAPGGEGPKPSVHPTHAAPPSEGGEARAPEVVSGEGSVLTTLPGEEAAVPQGADTAGLASTAAAASGVMSLSDIEELVDVDEIGEAEVAGVDEEVEEVRDTYAVGEGAGEELLGEAEELEEFDELEDVSAASVASGFSKASEPEMLEPEHAEEVEELVTLEEAGEEEPYPASTADGMDETIIDDRGIVIGLRGMAEGDEGEASVQRTLPELEALVTAGQPVQAEEEERSVELLPTIPEEVYREKAGVKHDDELSSLITEIETESATPEGAATSEGAETPEEKETPEEEDLPDLGSPEGLKLFIKGVLRTVGITKGALLTQSGVPAQTGGGIFEPNTIFGFSRTTKKRLVFDTGESLYEDFLKNGKTLFILEKVFKSKEVAKKFDRTDSSKIRSLVMSPVVKNGEVKGILIVGVSKGKKVDQESIIEKIKKIKEVIIRVF